MTVELLLFAGNLLIVWAGWTIKSELRHIHEKIQQAHETADEAHKRIDGILMRG